MQDLHTWLDKPANKGKAIELAAFLDLSKGAISHWRTNGVPMEHMERIVKFTGGAVTLQSLLEHARKCRVAAQKRRTAQVVERV